MKQIGYLLLAGALAAGGCLPESFLQGDKKPPKVEMKAGPPPVVTADEVNEKNASDRARALREELEYEMKPKPTASEK